MIGTKGSRGEPRRARRAPHVARIGIVALLFATAVCGPEAAPTPEGQNGERADTTAGTASPDSVANEPVERGQAGNWSVGITADSAAGATGTAVVTALRTGAHEAYDRVTIEFDADASLPGYHLEYVDRPLHECGSGRQIHPVGDAWLEIRLDGAAAHTETGEPTLPGRETEAAGTLLRRIYRTCDFEGVVTFVVALSSPQPYRVLDLDQPSRLVVDFQH